ncbi:MAG: hypothetical protein ACRDM1_09600 [Gaiellaceae bacterium]
MRALAPLLVIVPLTAVACGGSAARSPSSTTRPPPSMSSYVAAGNKVCIEADRRIFEIGPLSRDPKGWAKTAAAARLAIAQMRKVTPAPQRHATFDAMLRAARSLIRAIERVHGALVRSDIDDAAAAQRTAAHLQNRVHRAARAAGLTFCQQALTNWPA